MAVAKAVADAKTWAWEEFVEAMEKDIRVASKCSGKLVWGRPCTSF